MTDARNAYIAGRASADAGEPTTANPFEPDSAARSHWLRGYCHAQSEAAEDRRRRRRPRKTSAVAQRPTTPRPAGKPPQGKLDL